MAIEDNNTDDAFEDMLKTLSADAGVQAEIYKEMSRRLLGGGSEWGAYWDDVGTVIRNNPNSLDNGRLGTGTIKLDPPTELPQKICDYRKPKVYWFGTLHESNNLYRNEGFSVSRHWHIEQGMMLHYDLEEHFEGRRFIGISEPVEQHWDMIDNDFIHRLTGDIWVETRTLNKSSKAWEPQGEIFIGGSKPLKINEKSEEQIERVKGIEFRVV